MSHFVLKSHIHVRDALDDTTRSDTGCATPSRLPRTATLIAGTRDGPTRSFLQGKMRRCWSTIQTNCHQAGQKD